jgi:hypothetical protein
MANNSTIKDQFLKLPKAALFSQMFGRLYELHMWLGLAEQGRLKDNRDNDLVYVKSVEVRHEEWLLATFQLHDVEFTLFFSPAPTASCDVPRPTCYGIRRIRWIGCNEVEFNEDDLKELCPSLAGWRPRNTDYWYCKAALALQLRKQQQTTDNTSP